VVAGAVVVTAAVVGTAAVVVLPGGAVVADGEDVELAVLLPDPQPIKTSPATRAPAAVAARFLTRRP
jgi:hypothetical protein